MHAVQNVANQAALTKRIEAAAQKKSDELVKAEKEKSEKATRDKTTNDKLLDDDTASRGSAGGRSQGARQRKTIAEANPGKAQTERERDELREALEIMEGQFGSGTRPYDSEDGTRSSRVKKTAVARVLRSVAVTKTTQPQEQHKVVNLDVAETVAERVAKLLALRAGARASSSPDHRKGINQSPCLPVKSAKSARSDMKSVSQPPKPTGNRLTFADAVAVAPTPV